VLNALLAVTGITPSHAMTMGNMRTIQDNRGDGQVKIKLGSCNVAKIFGKDANIRIQVS
jgi:hypothetical protein